MSAMYKKSAYDYNEFGNIEDFLGSKHGFSKKIFHKIALWLSRFAEVDVEYECLSKKGVQFLAGEPLTYPFDIRNFYVANPERDSLEIGGTYGRIIWYFSIFGKW